MKIDFIPHWKLFDWIDYPTGHEISFLFLKCLVIKERTSYYFDNCGIGIDYLSTTKYNSLMIRLIAFSLNFQIKKKEKLRVVPSEISRIS